MVRDLCIFCAHDHAIKRGRIAGRVVMILAEMWCIAPIWGVKTVRSLIACPVKMDIDAYAVTPLVNKYTK
ncbi:hypothetical protein GBS0709_30930 [Edwardsiella tarda]|nr:hypothetical protein GBS0709_30930 [Edwardsiella tarda]